MSGSRSTSSGSPWSAPVWLDPQWRAAAHEWVEVNLERLTLVRTGDIEQPHVYPWSTVLRVPTASGDVWFKASTDALRHEAAIVTLLSSRRPDCIPPLLAVDIDRGWMLMSDAGERLRSIAERERSLDRWFDVLRLYAGVQLDLSDSVDKLLALGAPDMRLAVLPEKYEWLMDEIDADQVFRDASPRVAELCHQLAAHGIPETIQHDDLHDGQVFVRDGRHLLLDWGDACISHPFFTLSVTLEGGLAWGLDDIEDSVDIAPFRDAYLAPYAAQYDGDLVEASRGDLIEASRLAIRLGWACRAVNGHIPGEDYRTIARLRMFVTGHATA